MNNDGYEKLENEDLEDDDLEDESFELENDSKSLSKDLSNDLEKFLSNNFDINNMPPFRIEQERIKNIIEEHSKFWDSSPPYQRESVWQVPLKEKFISSIIRGIPTGQIHLLAKDNRHYDIADGKQRVNAILSFANDEFPYEDKESQKKYKYSTLKKHYDLSLSNSKCNERAAKLFTKFANFKMSMIIYDEVLPLKTKAAYFHTINTSLPLSTEEQLYTLYFNTKEFIRKFEKEIKLFKLAKVFFTKSKTKDKKDRLKTVHYSHDCLRCMFGDSLQSENFNWDNSAKMTLNLRKKSAETINNKIMYFKECQKDDIFEIDNFFKNENLLNKYKTYKKILNSLFSIIESKYQDSLNGKISNEYFKILYCFFLEKIDKKNITNTIVTENKDEFCLLIKNYYDWLAVNSNKDSEFTRRSATIEFKNMAQEKLEEIYNNLNIPKGKKKQKINDLNKANAILQSEGKCSNPNCNNLLNSNNLQIDHINPASKSSNTVNVQALCDYCNRKKSNLTQKDVNFLEPILFKEK